MSPRHDPSAAPIAGRLDEELRRQWIREFREELDDVLEVWFPRVIDEQNGGFLCDFDYRWKSTGPHRKLLEFQARQTRVAAVAAAFFPQREGLRAAADHGAAYLRDSMWDSEFGGFYRLLDRTGRPLEEGTKHIHGTSYAMSALVAYHRLTGSPESLELAKQAFEWLEEHAHDERHGGYVGYHRRDGSAIVDSRTTIDGYSTYDPVGTPLGLKDLNSTKDLLETMSGLASVWTDARVLERLREILSIVRERIIVPPGTAHMFFHPDWTPIPFLAPYCQNLHMAAVLLDVGDPLCAQEVQGCEATARTLLDCALAVAWDARTGGFAHAGGAFGPVYLEDEVIYLNRKYWWAQAEALAALVHFAASDGGLYAERAARHWQYIRTYLVDARHGGWMRMGTDADRRARKLPKAHEWKDGCHEGMALMECLQMLEDNGTEARG